MENTLISDHVVVQRISNAVAAGTSDITSSTVDMQGSKGCLFIILYGTLTTNQVTSASIQQSSDDSTYNALSGTSTTALADDDDNEVDLIDVWKPTDRYLQCVVARGTANAVVDGIIAVKYGTLSRGTTQHSTIHGTIQAVSPAES